MSRWLAAAAWAALGAGCVDTPTADSAQCTTDAVCGRCARCLNGACAIDLALPTCVDEAADPCDGLDSDGNGVIDDPDVCWAPVYSFSGGEEARCFSLTAHAAPPGCAGYVRAGSGPVFALPARPVPGTRPLRQCSLGRDHVLVADAPLLPGAAPDTVTVASAWQALGYDCTTLLGWAPVAPPDLHGDTTPHGGPSALARFFAPLAEGGHRRGYTLGSEALPGDATCELDGAVWVYASSAAARVEPPATCQRNACELRATGLVIRQDPADGASVATPAFLASWRIQNTGTVTWSDSWSFDRLQGVWSASSTAKLATRVHPGETYDFELDITPPASGGVGLLERWALRDDDGHDVVELSLRFSVASDDAAILRALSPAAGAWFAPGQSVPIRIELENSGTTVWNASFHLAHPSGDLLVNDNNFLDEETGPGDREIIRVGAHAPAEPGRYVDTWSVRNAGAKDIPTTTAAGVVRSFDTVVHVRGAHVGLVRGVAVPGPITTRPGTPFLQAYWIENPSETTAWGRGWSLEHVSGALSRVDSVSVDSPVEAGEAVLLVIPMRAPDADPEHGPWRDGWTLLDANREVIGLSRLQPDGTLTYGATQGAWLWTEVTVGEPCEALDATP